MDERQHLQALIAAPTQTRRLYPRGGFEGLEANTLQVLIAVKLLDKPTVGELMAELALAQGTVSTALGHLRQRGLVTTVSDEVDARRQCQSATRSGEKLLQGFLQHTAATPGPGAQVSDQMSSEELVAIIDAAMAAVRGDEYAQSLTDPESHTSEEHGDGKVRYYGLFREVGYPGRPCAVLETNLGAETIVLATGDAADYSTANGRLSCAAHIAGHRTAQRPTPAQVHALADAIAEAEERDGGGEFRLTDAEVDDALGEAD